MGTDVIPANAGIFIAFISFYLNKIPAFAGITVFR